MTCVLSLALGSCNTGQGISNGSTHGTLRVVNVIPNAGGPLNVTFDLKPFATALPFEGMTQYQTIDVGPREVQMSVAGSSTNVIDVTPVFLPDNAYTIVAFGALANAAGTSQPGFPAAKLRALGHAASPLDPRAAPNPAGRTFFARGLAFVHTCAMRAAPGAQLAPPMAGRSRDRWRHRA